jgi:hypothetical protein
MNPDSEPEMLPKYDFSKGVRGRYAQPYAEGTNVVVLDADVARFFPNADSVNRALRALAAVIQDHRQAG